MEKMNVIIKKFKFQLDNWINIHKNETDFIHNQLNKSPRDFSCAIFEWAAIPMQQNVHLWGAAKNVVLKLL